MRKQFSSLPFMKLELISIDVRRRVMRVELFFAIKSFGEEWKTQKGREITSALSSYGIYFYWSLSRTIYISVPRYTTISLVYHNFFCPRHEYFAQKQRNMLRKAVLIFSSVFSRFFVRLRMPP